MKTVKIPTNVAAALKLKVSSAKPKVGNESRKHLKLLHEKVKNGIGEFYSDFDEDYNGNLIFHTDVDNYAIREGDERDADLMNRKYRLGKYKK